MAKKKTKNIREKGKIRLSEYFKEINENQQATIIREKSIPSNVPERFIGLTGTIIGTRGSHKIIQINDGNKAKRFIIHPIHLKLIK